LASAWLIRRFIDAEATLVWLDKSEPPPKGAVSFGFEGAEFSNNRTAITFEQLLHAFDLESKPVLRRMASLVKNLETGVNPMAEAAGVQTLLQGAKRRALNNDDLLSECEMTFDLLHDAYCEPTVQS
jgi:hypothetical protein